MDDDRYAHRSSAELEMQLLSQPTPNNKRLPNVQGEEPSARARQRLPTLRSSRWEIFCFSSATVSLVAFFAILWNCHGKKNPTWSIGRVGITLNAIVSIVSTLFRSSLSVPVAQSISQLCWTWYTHPRPLRDICYYDSASRGPLGSLRLLIRLRFIHLASLGALITVAATALDTFFQQTVRYSSRSAVQVNTQAQAAAAHSYGINNKFTGEIQSAYTVLPYNMKVAAYNGLLSSNLGTLPNPPFSCSTGNCTWDPFGTLAISSQCINITDQVSLNCTKNTPDCNLIAPNDSTLQSLLNGSTYNDAFYIEAGPGIRHLPVLESYANMTGFLSLVQWVKARGIGNTGGALNSGIHPTTPFEAGRCFFYFSVIEVQAQVTNGVYTQNILQEYVQVQNRPSAPTSTLNGTDFFFIDPWDYPMSETLVYKPAFAKKPPNSNDTFTVPFETFAQLGSLLWSSDFLNGNVSVGFSSGALGNNENVLLLYEADNIPRAMENLAQYMTTEIRVDDSEILQKEQGNVTFVAAQQAVVGTVWTQQQIVTVEWAWLALPTTLLILSIILFTATCLKSSRANGVGLWASSPLTLFFQGQPNQDLATLRCSKKELNTAERMEDAAASLWAQITPTSLGGTIGVHQKVDHQE